MQYDSILLYHLPYVVIPVLSKYVFTYVKTLFCISNIHFLNFSFSNLNFTGVDKGFWSTDEMPQHCSNFNRYNSNNHDLTDEYIARLQKFDNIPFKIHVRDN